MKGYTFKSIRTKIAIWFLILTLIPLLFVLLITYTQRTRVIKSRTFNKITAIRDLKVQQLEYWITEKVKDMHVMSGDFEISGLENILEKKNKSAVDLEKIAMAQELLNRNKRNYADYEEIFIIGVNTGLIEISTNRNAIGVNKSKDPYFIESLKSEDVFIKDIYHSTSMDKPAMTISIPIFSLTESTHIIGVLVARINLDESLYPLLLNRVGLGETGETLIVNKNGVALNELRYYENAPLVLNITAEPAIKASQGKTGITITKDYRGKEVLAAYTTIPLINWGFVTKQDMQELNKPIRDMVSYFILLFIVTSLIITILAFRITKSLTKPIIDINLTTKKIKSGDYSARNIISSEDELGSLSISINEMAESIETRLIVDAGVVAISKTIIGKSSLHEFSTKLLQQLMELTHANMSTFYVLNDAKTKFKHLASIGANEELLKPFSVKNPEGEFGNAISKQQIYYLKNIPENTIFKYKTTVGDIIPKEIITVPIIVEKKVVAIISLINIIAFNKESLSILEESKQAINVSYSELQSHSLNVILAENLTRLNNELEAKSEVLQEQTIELQRGSDELEEQNVELEMQKKELDKANRLKTTFLSNMSHELRTPLNSVIALSGVLNRKLANQIPEEEHSYLSVIERNGKNLLSLINNILDISRIESGREEIEIEKFNVNALISELVDMLSPQAVQKKIELIQVAKNKKVLISSDIVKCRHILQNLIGNAVKFTDIGKVEITANKTGNNLIITVLDTGIGIDKSMIPHVFDEFRQVDDGTSRRFEGSGLGLAIAKKYANLLGGLLTIDSTIKKGSKFTLRLPLLYENEIDVDLEEIANSKTSELGLNEKSDYNFSSKTILLVEDNEFVVIQIKDILKEKGYNILVAKDGVEALEIIQHTIPDGIILDLMMPRVDGFEVLKTLREEELTAKVPVLILTAKHISKAELKFLKRNNIHQLIQKGDVERKELLNSIFSMVFTEIEKKAAPKRIFQIIKGKPLVLVVEDNPDNMITINAMLKDNYTIIKAIDGEIGLKMAKKYAPNLIIMDIALPNMDGYEAFKAIRAIEKLQQIPIIALTASALSKDRESILTYGFDAYIPKPIDEKVFYKIIKEMLYGE